MRHPDPCRALAGRQRGKHGGGLWGIESDSLREQRSRDFFGEVDDGCRCCFYADFSLSFILGVPQGVVVDGEGGITATTAIGAGTG